MQNKKPLIGDLTPDQGTDTHGGIRRRPQKAAGGFAAPLQWGAFARRLLYPPQALTLLGGAKSQAL